jgi:serine protease AprX
VAAIIAGTGEKSDGFDAGVAPGAHLVSLLVLDDAGAGQSADVIAALDWVLQNKEQYNIRVANLSLGHPVVEAAAEDPLVQAAEAVWNAGVIVVCPAGNAGRMATAPSPALATRSDAVLVDD